MVSELPVCSAFSPTLLNFATSIVKDFESLFPEQKRTGNTVLLPFGESAKYLLNFGETPIPLQKQARGIEFILIPLAKDGRKIL